MIFERMATLTYRSGGPVSGCLDKLRELKEQQLGGTEGGVEVCNSFKKLYYN